LASVTFFVHSSIVALECEGAGWDGEGKRESEEGGGERERIR
jgi:hypothetical protein